MLRNKKLLSNIFSLFILQGTTYVLPLISLPYLVRTLGQENYGVLVFSAALIQYFVIFSDFGFNYTATQKISISRDNKQVVSQIFSTVLFVKLIMMVICFGIMLVIVKLLPGYAHYRPVFIVNFLTVVGNVLFPLWFFQGIEEMRIITVVNVLSKTLATIGLFLFVKDSSDIVLASFFQSLGFLMAGIFGLLIAIYKFSIKITFRFNVSSLFEEFKEGWKVFVSTLSINVYNQGSIIILGIFAGKTVVAYYGIAQKIVQAVIGLGQPFAQSIYPVLCKLIDSNFSKYLMTMKKIKIASLFGTTILGICTFLSARILDKLVTGTVNQAIVFLISFWSIILVCIMNNIIYNTFILSMKKYNQMQKMYITISIIFLIISIPLTYYFKSVGMSVSMLVVEGFIFINSFLITRETNATNQNSAASRT